MEIPVSIAAVVEEAQCSWDSSIARCSEPGEERQRWTGWAREDEDELGKRWKSNQAATGREMKVRGENREGRRSRSSCSWSDMDPLCRAGADWRDGRRCGMGCSWTGGPQRRR